MKDNPICFHLWQFRLGNCVTCSCQPARSSDSDLTFYSTCRPDLYPMLRVFAQFKIQDKKYCILYRNLWSHTLCKFFLCKKPVLEGVEVVWPRRLVGDWLRCTSLYLHCQQPRVVEWRPRIRFERRHILRKRIPYCLSMHKNMFEWMNSRLVRS